MPSGGVTLKRRCTYRPSVIYLIVNKLLSLSLSLSLSLCVRERNRQTEREREREREEREGERRVCVSRRRQARVHTSCSLCGGCQPRTSPRTCKSARQRSSASSTNIQLVLLGVNISLSHVHIHLLLLLLVFAFSWPGASDPAPYSSHPHPHTPVTPILCTMIHASQVYEVHYGFRLVYLTYLNPKPGI